MAALKKIVPDSKMYPNYLCKLKFLPPSKEIGQLQSLATTLLAIVWVFV